MKDNSIKRNYIYNTVYQSLLIILPLITTPYVARVLGADGVGINSYIGAIVSYFSLFAMLGTATYGQREISYLQNDREMRSRVFWEIEILNVVSVCLCGVFYFIFVLFQIEHKDLYLIYSIQLITVMFDITWLFTGMEDFKSTVLRSALVKVINVILIFALIKSRDDLWLYILLMVGLNCLGYLTFWVSLKKYVDYSFVDVKPFRHIKGTIALFIPTIAIQLYMQMDKIMIGTLTADSFQNGYYEQSIKLVRMLLTLLASLSTVMVPRMGRYISENNYGKMKTEIYKIVNFVWLIGCPLCLGLCATISKVVPWFLGDGYDQVILITYFLAPQILIVGLNNITAYQCLIPLKKQKLFTLSVCLGALLNFIANYFLIPRAGAVGAAVASTMAEIVVLMVELFYLKDFISMKKMFCKFGGYFIPATLMSIVVYFVGVLLNTGMITTILQILIGVIIYFGILFIIKDDFFVSLIKKHLE